jgi:hypothetical protein
LHVTPANAGDRGEAGHLTRAVQIATSENVELAFTDQGYNGPNAASAAEANGIESNRQRRRRVSCCCRAGGWWSGLSPGRPAFAAWSRIMSDTPPPWPDFTALLSSASG